LKDGEIHLTDAKTAREVGRFGKETDGPVTTFAFVDDGKVVLSGHSRQTDVTGAGGGKNRTLQYQLSYFARDASNGKKLRQVGETATETRRSLEGPPQHGLFPSADGKTVVLAGDRGAFQFCDWTTGKKDRETPVPWKPQADDPIRRVVLSGNAQTVAVATARGVVSVWDLSAAKELRRMETTLSIEHMALSPDGKTLAVTYQTPSQVGAVLMIYGL
jgi:WD40 repeat protein